MISPRADLWSDWLIRTLRALNVDEKDETIRQVRTTKEAPKIGCVREIKPRGRISTIGVKGTGMFHVHGDPA